MASIKSTNSTSSSFMDKPKKKGNGIHSKKKSSKNKKSKNYVKPYKSQGR